MKRYILISLLIIIGLLAVLFNLTRANLPGSIKSNDYCAASKVYRSESGKFYFCYPKNYPISYKTGDDLIREYNYKYKKYSEWIQFRNKFMITNKGDDQSDNLADITVEKTTEFRNFKQYKEKITNEYNIISLNYRPIPPQYESVRVAGIDTLHALVKKNQTGFDIPDDTYLFFYDGDTYIIEFHYKNQNDKKSMQNYIHAKDVILSTFHINPQAYRQKPIKNTAPTPFYENEALLIKDLPNDTFAGWKKYPTSFIKTINGENYILSFQLNNQDYLKKGGAYAKNISQIDKVKTRKGTEIYILKSTMMDKDKEVVYIYGSSCKPTVNSACSIPFGNQLLFINLHPYKYGDQYVRGVDFTKEGTNTLISEFTHIIESSNF